MNTNVQIDTMKRVTGGKFASKYSVTFTHEQLNKNLVM